MVRDEIVERIYKKTVKVGDCLVWTGAKTKVRLGYGIIKISTFKTKLAHRIMWEKTNGEIPGNMLVLHTCDNSLCVNPEHLFLGTQKDNMDDARKKGRGNPKWYYEKKVLPGKARGERNGTAKLTSEKVMAIFNDDRPRKEISRVFSISNQQISNIKRKQSWKHLFSNCHKEEHE